MNNHIIGHARTIQTAVLVCAYLRERFVGVVPKDAITYEIQTMTERDGYWSSKIVVHLPELNLETSSRLVDTCRAFVAGRGETWA